MKKWTALLILLVVIVLTFAIISMARQVSTQPRVQDMSLRPSSAIGDVINSESDNASQSLGKDSNRLKLTGAVVDLDESKK